MERLPTGTVTFLFTDIEGSTRLLEKLGERYVEALAEHRRILREAFVRHSGVEVDTQGDSFLVAFADAREAAAAAAEAQAALADGPVSVRMGLHTGEPLIWAEGYAGVEVHRGARIAAAAHGGQIVLSEPTAVLLDSGVLRPLGPHRLKDLSEPQPLYQLGSSEFPPLRTLHASNLPAQAGALIGRERELDETRRLLAGQVRLLTLSGPGGSGKTRLGLQIAAELSDNFVDGVFWVPLAAVTEAEFVLPTIAQTIGANDGLADHVGAKRMLLLLDNFEQVLEAGPHLSRLLDRCPNLKLLVTTRAVLRVSAEHEYFVEPLPESDAIELFGERARAIVEGFEPDEAVAEICRRLDGLPLAIELAAVRVRILSAEELLSRLEQRLPLLVGAPRDAPERQRTLRATIEWSHDLLEPDEQRLFARLAIFPGSFDVRAAEAVCDADIELLEGLVEQSLLRRWASGRLGMLETIREFAVERLAESGERAEIARRAFDYFHAFAEEAAPKLIRAEQGEWLDRLERERDNIRGALHWALEEGEQLRALQLATALGKFWVVRGPREGCRWLEAALHAASNAPPELRADGLLWLASTLFMSGDVEEACNLDEQALALFRRLGDTRGIAATLDRFAAAQIATGRLAEARDSAEESVALFKELADRPSPGRTYEGGVMYPLPKLSHLEWQEGNRERAVALMEETVALAREAADAWWTAGHLHSLAEMVFQQGDRERAAAHGRESTALARELGDRLTLIYCLGLLAAVAASEGELGRAGRLWGALETLEQDADQTLDPESRALYMSQIDDADAEFGAGLEAGFEMSEEEAIELALNA